MSLAGVEANRLVDVGGGRSADDRDGGHQLCIDAQLDDGTSPQPGDIDDGEVDIIETGLLVGVLNDTANPGCAVAKNPFITSYVVKGNGAGGIETNNLTDASRQGRDANDRDGRGG